MKEQHALITINDWVYFGMENMEYPIVLPAHVVKKNGHIVGYTVKGKELIKLGAKKESFNRMSRYYFDSGVVTKVRFVGEDPTKKSRNRTDSTYVYASDDVAVACACAMSCL